MSDSVAQSSSLAGSPIARVDLCQRLLAGSGLLLIASTWRLWMRAGSFPSVPLFAFAANAPVWLDYSLLAVLGIALSNIAVRNNQRQTSIIVGVLALLVLLAINQHRLQPWAWFLVLGMLITWSKNARSLWLMRLLVASVYVYSGISKCDHSFVTGGGQYLLDGLLKPVGLGSADWRPTGLTIVLAAFPVAEILAGILILIPRCHRLGLVLAITMHVSLLLVLGPLGLGHKPAVLIWNAMFIALAVLMLFRVRSGDATTVTRKEWLPFSIAAIAIVLPLMEPFGVDHWIAWSLYSSRSERMKMFIHVDDVDQLPISIREHVMPPPPLEDWCQLRLDRWSLAATDAPIYPQNRFRHAIAKQVGAIAELRKMRVVSEGNADRWTGKRDRTESILRFSATH